MEGMVLGDILDVAKPHAGASLQVNGVSVNPNERTYGLRPGDKLVFGIPAKRQRTLILGGVRQPGEFDLEPGDNARLLIARAGGLVAHADPSKATLIRGDKTIPLVLEQELLAGDVIRIPLVENPKYLSVGGYVSRPGKVAFVEGMTLTQALEQSGWPLFTADLKGITIIRVENGTSKTIRADFAAIKAGAAKDIVLKAGDAIQVPRKR
jgi:protein involved in polysaccharide export with SLBB domain